MGKKYFIVGSPTEEYYPWLMENGENSGLLLFDSVEDAKKAIADNSWVKSEANDFWIGEKIDYNVKEVNSMRKSFKESRNDD